ncbi:MAG: peptide chain release factor 1, partial [Hadesarchaea archaeon CG08_land_8_20_14_0_20_51_8]
SGVPGKHGKGGQSARRFERLIEIAANEYMKRIAEAMNETFSQMSNLKAIIVGGPGPTKEEFVKSEVLHENIKKKIFAVLDTGYTDEYGIKELVEKSSEVLKDLEITKEKALMQRFMTELVAGRGLSVYGERHIRDMLEKGAIDLLLVSEDLHRFRGFVRCQSCGHEFQETVEDTNLFKKQLIGRSCPKCGELKLALVETKDLVQELCDLADRFNTRVEFISSETDEGKQLLIAFKGIVALLRFA